MAEGLQYKENLKIISGGYPGEDVGSNGVIQNWTDTPDDHGSNTVTYHYRDSSSQSNANSTQVNVKITDTWTAVRDEFNNYRITVTTTIDSITRTKIGNPNAYSVYMFVRRTAGGGNLWTSGGCVNAAAAATHATNINLGTVTFTLPPGHPDEERGTVYFRSNTCGHNNDRPPSRYIDEFWLGVNFRNTLPPDYRPGKVRNPQGTWLSTNRSGGKCHIRTDVGTLKELRTINGAVGTDNPPYIRHNDDTWRNQRLIGQQ